MDESNRDEPSAFDAFLMGLIPMILYGLCVIPPAGLAALAVVIGPLYIWRTVRWLNRRDDPRYQKRPPDAP